MAGTGGKREGAGRKSARDERLKNLVISKSWEKLNDVIDKIDSKEDIKNFCLAIGLKDMVNKHGDHDGEELKLIPIYGGISGHTVDKKDIPTKEED